MPYLHLTLLITVALFTIPFTAGASSGTRIEKLAWEQHANCKVNYNTRYNSENSHNIYVCTVHYKDGMPKMFPSWQMGKIYVGAYSLDRKFSLDPIYEHIYADQNYRDKNSDNYVLFKKYGDKTYTRTGYKTDGSTFEPVETPIEYISLGYVQNSTPCKEPDTKPYLCDYYAAFSNGRKSYHLLDSLADFSRTIDNVDTDPERENRFPSVQKLKATHNIYTGGDTVMIRHNLNGKVFYQIYQSDGKKLGPEIPYEKVVYFHLRTSTYELSKTAPYQARPWIHNGADFYLPIIHFSDNTFFDALKSDYGNFLGIRLADIDVPADQAYTGAVVAKYPKFKSVGGFAFKDDQGVYYSYNYYDVFMYRQKPDKIIKSLEGDPKNFYREIYSLPFYTGYVKSDGQPEKIEVRCFQDMNNTYSIGRSFWKSQSLDSYKAENVFASLEEIEAVLMEKQKRTIARLSEEEKKRKEREAYEAESQRIKDRVAKNMASTWAEQDRKEKEHADRMKVLDHNEKHKKPNPLLTLDLKKIYDSEGAERRAACFRKMSESKKAYVSGRQNWHFQGKCK